MNTARPATPTPDKRPAFLTVATNSIERIFTTQWSRFHKDRRRARNKPSPTRVHSLRVTTRRLLAWHQLLSGVISPATQRGNCALLKKSLRAVGDLRDAQIQKKIVKSQGGASARRFYRWLCRREKRLASKVRRCPLHSARYRDVEQRARKELRKELKKLSPETVSTRLQQATRRAFEAAKQRKDQARPEDTGTIHRARVALKRFRYMFEAVALVPPAGLVDQMRRQQDLMGQIQDLEVLLALLEKYRHRHPRDAAAAQALTIGMLRQRNRLIATWFGVAGRLDRFWPEEK